MMDGFARRWIAAPAVSCLVLSPASAADLPPPDFDVPLTTINLSVAQCGDNCALSAWFAPEVKLTTSSVWITNKSAAPISLSVALDASGTYPPTWSKAVTACLQPATGQGSDCPPVVTDVSLPVNGRGVLRVKVDASQGLPPGKYEGNLLLTATDTQSGTPVRAAKTIKLSSRVRANVTFALLAILAGVIGGRLFKQISAQDAVQIMALYGRYVRLKEAPPLDANDPLSPWWNNQLEMIKAQLDQSTPDTAAIGTSIKKLEDTATLVHSIASIRAFVTNLPSADPRRSKVLVDLQSALSAIVQGNIDQAKVSYNTAVSDAFAVSAAAPPVLAALGTIDPTARASFAALDAASSATQTSVAKVRANIISALNWISGDASVPVEVAYSYVRPVMTLALVVVLAIYGVWQYYSGSDDVAATFGAAGISNYAIMFLWGFSSQVVTSTLQTLSFQRPATPH
jgi:hypothetical protein